MNTCTTPNIFLLAEHKLVYYGTEWDTRITATCAACGWTDDYTGDDPTNLVDITADHDEWVPAEVRTPWETDPANLVVARVGPWVEVRPTGDRFAHVRINGDDVRLSDPTDDLSFRIEPGSTLTFNAVRDA